METPGVNPDGSIKPEAYERLQELGLIDEKLQLTDAAKIILVLGENMEKVKKQAAKDRLALRADIRRGELNRRIRNGGK